MSTNTAQKEPDDVLGMSDEDILKMDPSEFDAGNSLRKNEEDEPTIVERGSVDREKEDSEVALESNLDEPAKAQAKPAEDEGEAEPQAEAKPEVPEDSVEEMTNSPETGETTDKTDETDSENTKEAESAEKTEKSPETKGAIDYKAEYERIMAPFKASGREIKPESPDDVVRLMQMGADYNRKMAALKPNMRILKMLERHELLDEQKLGFLIDIEKKNPEAIAKLLKDSQIDPLDIDTDKESNYQPSVQPVTEAEIELDEVVGELQGSQHFAKTLDVVASQWDAASKQAIGEKPQLLKLMHDHVATGVYDVVSQEVERERMFGRLSGMSDFEAYCHVCNALQERGGLNAQGQSQATTQAGATTTTPQAQKDDAQQKQALNDKKRAASPTRSGSAPKANTDFNPLALPDDEFDKLVQGKFL